MPAVGASREAATEAEPTPSVESVLPHAHPMILIDGVTQENAGATRSAVRIREASMFYEAPHGVPAYVGVEYIAQTVAAHAGLQAIRDGDPVRVGFLLGTRRYDCTAAYFPLGAELSVRVAEAYQGPAISKFEGSIVDASSGRELAHCHVTVYLRTGAPGEP